MQSDSGKDAFAKWKNEGYVVFYNNLRNEIKLPYVTNCNMILPFHLSSFPVGTMKYRVPRRGCYGNSARSLCACLFSQCHINNCNFCWSLLGPASKQRFSQKSRGFWLFDF